MSDTTITWGGSSAGDWSVGTNWLGDLAPGGGDIADLAGTSFTISVTSSISVDGIIWDNPTGDPGLIDIASGSLTVGPASGGGTIFSNAVGSSGGTIELETTGSGSTLQIGTSPTQSYRISPQSVDFVNDGASTATVFWDTSTVMTNAKLVVNDFDQGDTLEATTASPVTITGTSYTGGVLTITGTGGSFTAISVGVIDSVTPTAADFTATYNAVGGYIEITSDIPCFLRGTHIATLRGEVAVEDLRIGDLVVTATGGALPIKWIGTRGFITRLVDEHHRAALLPIRIAAGALGEASPVRDLHVSPEHMLCLEGVLIPAGKLLNGTTITRADDFDVVRYFHIELPRHAVLYAEGALVESFLDTGNRNMFANVLSYLELGHDLDAPAQPACLPIVTEGEALDSARSRLAERARHLGLATTGDDDVYLQVDGIALRPESREGEHVRFAVPAGAQEVHIVSRSVVPADVDPANADRRQLGICLGAMSLCDGGFTLDLAPSYAGFTTGFHAAEEGRRWTQGDATLPEDLTAAMPDGFTLELTVIDSGLHYPSPKQAEVIPFSSRRSA